ncbi:hypothetical protein WMO40_17295 [Bacillaceae bacterium CLA-AA-H227]|uniref:Uncharacterized protein n=1 Tax=Robertmurraya yapensis (ex Hitch et al 2024) TaxID=3133160 RepID=A0ACC6SF46_9BACI
MLKKSIFIVIVSLITLSINQSVFAFTNSNQEQTIQSADDFYNIAVDKQRYEEYNDAKLKMRELTTIKGLPKVFEDVDSDYFNKQGKNYKNDFIEYTQRFNPERQVYYYFNLREAENDIFYQSAMFDAKTKELIYADKGNW